MAENKSLTPAPEEIAPELQELILVFQEELPFIEKSLQKSLELSLDQDAPLEAKLEAQENYGSHLERFGEGAGSVGFDGLHSICVHVRENIAAITAAGRAITQPEAENLLNVSDCIQAYFQSPLDLDIHEALTESLAMPEWPLPLDEDEALLMRSLLLPPVLSEVDQDEEPQRPTVATEEDVSLALPDDANPELIEAMLVELPTQAAEFTQAIQSLTSGSLDNINVAQRIAHTLKGAGNTVGIRGVANLSHYLEDILVVLAQKSVPPTGALSASLMKAADCLEEMNESLTGIAPPPADAQMVLQEILDWANLIDSEGLPTEEVAPPLIVVESAKAPESEPKLKQTVEQKPQETSAPVTMMRVPAHLVDNLLRMAGETMILTGQVHELLRHVAGQSGNMQDQLGRLQHIGSDLETLIDVKNLNRNTQEASATGMDPLEMDQYTELHTTSRMLVENATDAWEIGGTVSRNLNRLDELLTWQERQSRELHEAVLNTRMIPVESILQRLHRSVRQTNRLTGKQVELTVLGEGTHMDSDVLNEMADPLMHILRNAIDHGIEVAEGRIAAGKEEMGHIELSFSREGNNILMCCRDDGAGIDYDAIRQRAESQGLITAGKAVSEEELKRLILIPNFSTRSEVTQTSGRGVGLDMVYSRILTLGGSMNMESEAGNGCVIELRIPVSLLSTHALLVQLRNQVVAISDHGVEQILHHDDGEIYQLAEAEVFRTESDSYPITELTDLLGMQPDRRNEERSGYPVLLVQGQTGVTAVRVQEVMETRDLVVKNLGYYLPKLNGIIGATILGDGSVTPVIDLPELLSSDFIARRRSETFSVQTTEPADHMPTALVVDDSLSARRSLTQLLEDSGWVVRTARDGIEAAELIEIQAPDIVLTDLEMPRMNGLELTSHLRSQEDTAKLPIIMITSRSGVSHRNIAQDAGVDIYLTKPFLEDELMDHIETRTRSVG